MVKAILSCIFAMCLCACVSTRRTDRLVIEHQAEIDRLESELRSRDRAIDNAVRELEGITTRSTGMEGTIDELIELFDEYQRTVEQLLRDYRATTSKDKETAQDSKDTVQGNISYIPSSANSDFMHGCRFHMLCEGHKVATVAGYTFIGDEQ